MEKKSVLLNWAKDLSWKKQSVLLSSLRGPDTHFSPNIKKISRWVRAVLQHNADPSKNYMKQENLPSLKSFENEIDFCTVHYGVHLLQALEVIGYEHPSVETASIARNYYFCLAEKVFHLNPETKRQMDRRLEDKI